MTTMDYVFNHITKIRDTLQNSKQFCLIFYKHATGLTFDLRQRINDSLLFNIPNSNTSSNALPITHPCYLLIHNFIPAELTTLFYNYIGNRHISDSAFHEFITPFIKELNSATCTERS
ncbi:unnamed protein product [Rhizophagus irregularis]|nr:unnamed protein product [Rhizophagus irregularis]